MKSEFRTARSFTVFDCHCEGDVEKVVTAGLPTLPAGTMFEKMKYLREHHDDIRTFFLHEPRGSMIESVNFIVPSDNPHAAAGFIIAEAEEYPAMSGGNTISVATVLLKSGQIAIDGPVTRFKLEAPGGLIDIECDTANGNIGAVKLINRPAFVYCLDREIQVPDLGRIRVDVAYGGMTYVLVSARDCGVELKPTEGRYISQLGQQIKAAAAAQIETKHPENSEIAGITQTLFFDDVSRRKNGDLMSTNAVVVSPGRIDRCPCGTGTSARLAVMHARGQIVPGETFIHKSIIGSTFSSQIQGLATVGSYDAVIPMVSGRSWITAIGTYVLEEDDPFPTGYKIADTWPNSGSIGLSERKRVKSDATALD